MSSIEQALQQISSELKPFNASLIAVTKGKNSPMIMEAYNFGQRSFGENYVQELIEKQKQLPADIQWHFIGHLQTNKVKFIAPFISLIHGVDSFKLLKEINKEAAKINRVIDCLLQLYIATEESKFGFSEKEIFEMINNSAFNELNSICIKGVMAMATNTTDESLVRKEFKMAKTCFEKMQGINLPNLKPEFISTGMSNDYKLALAEGSNMVRIGSLIFGERN